MKDALWATQRKKKQRRKEWQMSDTIGPQERKEPPREREHVAGREGWGGDGEERKRRTEKDGGSAMDGEGAIIESAGSAG